MKWEIFIPQRSLFYCCYADYINNKRREFKHDELFEELNNYHPKMKLTVEVSPRKVLP